jgi:phytoene desaturase
MPNTRIAVIGAGFGGLSVASYLAKAGHDVTIFEKNDQPGGRAYTFMQDGFRFEAGPSWYLMPDVFEDFFSEFDHKPSDFYELRSLVPSYRVYGQGDDEFDVRPHTAAFADFDRREPGSGARLTRHINHTRREYEIVRRELLELDGISRIQYMRSAALRMAVHPRTAGSFHSRVSAVVKDPLLQQILEFMVVFLGGSPKNIPALYGLLNWVDLGLGVWYPRGGFEAVARAFEAVALEQGVTINYNSPVEKIISNADEVTGLRVGDTEQQFDLVVANADYAYVEQTLLDESDRSHEDHVWQSKVLAPSAVMGFIGVRGDVPLLHHSLFFDADWHKSFSIIFEQQAVPKRPLFYVCTPSKSDKVAPDGHESMFILIPTPAGVDIGEQAANMLVDQALLRIAERTAQTDLIQRIVTRRVTTPQYFRDTFNATGGTAFGLAHTLSQTGPFRPPIRSQRLANLYFVGQFTNPGTGVPLVILGGKVVAERIARDMRR